MKFSSGIVAVCSLIAAIGAFSLPAAQTDTMPRQGMLKHHKAVMTKPPAAKDTVAHKKTLITQATCPVMGSPIDKSIYVDYKGKRVYFCCSMCPETFKQDPEKYLKVLADKGEAPISIPKK
jgi:YHS domain-containing protein